MRKIILLLSILLSVFITTKANNNDPIVLLDSSTQVSILTCNPGNEVYSTFGHSAIWIMDSVNHINKVYNYGTFAFEDNFIYKFVKGDLNYYLSIDNINGFVNDYIYEQRGITRQVLNLNIQEKQKLFVFLSNNYKPENRTYRYDFLFDNCSTRILDAIDSATDHKIKYDYTFITHESSYRQLIASKAGYMKWLTFGMDLMLGIPCDKKASNKDHLFLPDNLMTAYFFATINRGGTEERLVAHTYTLLDIPVVQEATPFYISPLFIFSLLAILLAVITLYEYKKNKWYRAIDISIYLLLVVIGLLFIFMWTSTRHMVAHMNLGLFFANPLLIITIACIVLQKYPYIKQAALIYASILLMLLLSWHWIFLQKFNWALFPFILILFIRAYYMFYYSKKKINGTT